LPDYGPNHHSVKPGLTWRPEEAWVPVAEHTPQPERSETRPPVSSAEIGGLVPAGYDLSLGATVQRARLDPGSLTPAAVLRLQRTIGNRAVGQLLNGSSVPAGALGGLAPGIGPDDEAATIGGLTTAEVSDSAQTFGGAIRREPPTTSTATGTATTAAITISTKTNSGPTWNPHGHFDWRVGFSTSGRNGWIVQQVENTYSGTDSAGKAFTTGLPTPKYWEAWAVDGSGAVTPAVGANNDYWIRPSRGASTKGSWSMKGEVHFTTTDPATQGFTKGGAKDAGILLSTTTAPTGLGSVLLNRSANGTWDSTGSTPTHTGATS
jgi:hypothetical protein